MLPVNKLKEKGNMEDTGSLRRDGSILFSIRRNFPQECNLNGLSLIVGLAIIKVLEKDCLVEGFKIKWPNDIYFRK